MSPELIQQKICESTQGCSNIAVAKIKQYIRDDITFNFLKGNINLFAYHQKLECIPCTGRVRVDEYDDLRKLLRLSGWPALHIPDTMVHEAAHYEVAAKYKLRPHFGVEIVKINEPPFTEACFAYVEHDLPLNLGDKLARKILREIIIAPKNLSQHDRLGLGLTV